jgi:hypothetical protein
MKKEDDNAGRGRPLQGKEKKLVKTIMVAPSLIGLIDAKAKATGSTFSKSVHDALAAHFGWAPGEKG